jgi:hypothetical protein
LQRSFLPEAMTEREAWLFIAQRVPSWEHGLCHEVYMLGDSGKIDGFVTERMADKIGEVPPCRGWGEWRWPLNTEGHEQRASFCLDMAQNCGGANAELGRDAENGTTEGRDAID